MAKVKKVKFKKVNNHKFRISELNRDKKNSGDGKIHTSALKIIPLNDIEQLLEGDMCVFVYSEDSDGNPISTETRQINTNDFLDPALADES